MNQKLLFLAGNKTLVKNLNLNQANMNLNELVLIGSLETEILKFMINNLIFNEGSGIAIKIASMNRLYIYGMVFNKAIINGK